MDEINARIKKEICHETLSKLADKNLLGVYLKKKSVRKQIETLNDVLENYVDDETKEAIVGDYILQLIPPGTKGNLRGNMFNAIVKEYIMSLGLDSERFEIRFEKDCVSRTTYEKPDWYILEKSNNKIIIGMNQLDLWGGGHQSNRASNYIRNTEHNTENSKLLCVVCKYIEFKSVKNKSYKIFEIGFRNNTLCYLNNLQNIIVSYFQ